ncbi:MAG TPA: acyl carrier protein [Thermoanaerobaculia bacterium]|nr:acyl carrier protein [Thermoanaerobaculia bacterium]
MIERENVVRLILDIAGELNATLNEKIDITRGADAPLYGRDGVLDSLALVSFVVAVEQEIQDRLDVVVALADERAVSQKSSPFRTVGTLADYAWSQIGAADV